MRTYDFYSFDTGINSWTAVAPFGSIVRQGAVGFSIGSKGYMGTGHSNGYLKDFWQCDTALDAWTQKADFGGTGRAWSVGFSINGKGYIGTGEDASTRRNDFWEYDPSLNTWTQKASVVSNGRQNAVGFSIAGKGYTGTSISLRIAYPVPVISRNGNILSVQASFASYRWMHNGDTIIGATTNTTAIAERGAYMVEVTDSTGCTGRSDTLFVNDLVVEGLLGQGAGVAFPNPARTMLNFGAEHLDAAVIRPDGTVCIQTRNVCRINVQQLPEGVYLPKLRDPVTGRQQIVRFVKGG